jgi:hypothetical protein
MKAHFFTRAYAIIPLVVVLLCTTGCSAVPTTAPTPGLHAIYEKLAADVAAYNGNPPEMDAWTMNPEHLFLGIDDPTSVDSLRERSAAFSRQKGGLDFLFDKLLNHGTSEEEILGIAEILVFFGQETRKGDGELFTQKAELVKAAIHEEQIKRAIAKYPDAPIEREILYSAVKATPPKKPLT